MIFELSHPAFLAYSVEPRPASAGSFAPSASQLGGGIDLTEANRRARKIGKIWAKQGGKWTREGLAEARRLARPG